MGTFEAKPTVKSPFFVELGFEFFVKFPKTVVGGVNDTRAVVESSLHDDLRDELLNFEGWQGWNLRRHEVPRGPLVPDCGGG